MNCNHAELMAISNALTVANKLYEMANKTIVVVTDSQSAIDYVELAREHKTLPHRITRKGNKSPWTRSPELFALAKFALDLIPASCTLRINKLAAHSKADGKRSYVNNLVDRAAKAKMKEKRQQSGKEAP